jgi:enoyl-CoA hydratase/carnithine racemase
MAGSTEEGVSVYRDGRILHLSLDRQDRGNALDASGMQDMVDALSTSEDAYAILVAGSGKHFCSGVDLDCAYSNPSAAANRFYDVLTALLTCPRPVIASINGTATGLGWLIAACCDTRLASTNAQFQFPELKIGIPAFAAVDLLRDQVSPAVLNRILFQGETIKAEILFEDGWLDAICAPAELNENVEAALTAAAAHPRDAFAALKAHKNAISLERLTASRRKSLDFILHD